VLTEVAVASSALYFFLSLNMLYRIILISIILAVCLSVSKAFIMSDNKKSSHRLYGIGDILSKAFANDASLPPPKNPGLSKEPSKLLYI